MASYADERKAAIRSINAQNRRRAKEMERNVAKYLEGLRVPYSGSGVQKGDCDVVTDKIGRVFIECKYSAGRHKTGEPNIRIDFRWLDKMATDAVSMRAKFAALVFQYHNVRLSKYVIVPLKVFVTYDNAERLINASIIDAKNQSGINLLKSTLDTAFSANPNSEQIALLYCTRGEYVIMDIDIFKSMIHGNDLPSTRAIELPDKQRIGIEGYDYTESEGAS